MVFEENIICLGHMKHMMCMKHMKHMKPNFREDVVNAFYRLRTPSTAAALEGVKNPRREGFDMYPVFWTPVQN